MCDKNFLVFFETSGNQDYIFGTNKLAENTGASEAIYRVGTKYIVQALNDVFDLAMPMQSPLEITEWLQDPEKNRPIESDGVQVEVITATSGKAMVLVKDENKARDLITKWSLDVAMELPGVQAKAVYADFCFDVPGSLVKAIRQVHKLYDRVRTGSGSNRLRDQNLPFLQPEASSSLPADPESLQPKWQRKDSVNNNVYSRMSLTKRNLQGKAAKNRFQTLFPGANIVSSIDKLTGGSDSSWIAVVHADINGLGKVFMGLKDHIQSAGNREYIKAYRDLSLGLDEVVREAFKDALDDMDDFPFAPIIIGGDDITLICRGEDALQLVKTLLERFEKRVEASDVVKRCGVKGFGMSAGVAIVKHHFPFFTAYSLAEELTESAKIVKQKIRDPNGQPIPACSVDFHVMYDTSVIDLDGIRERLKVDGKWLTAKPYVITDKENLDGTANLDWLEGHKWSLLEQAVEIFDTQSNQRNKGGKQMLPNSQAHEIRKLLFSKPEMAEKRFEYLKYRYRDKNGFNWPTAQQLFYEADGKTMTLFVDALEAKDFMKPGKDGNSSVEDK